MKRFETTVTIEMTQKAHGVIMKDPANLNGHFGLVKDFGKGELDLEGLTLRGLVVNGTVYVQSDSASRDDYPGSVSLSLRLRTSEDLADTDCHYPKNSSFDWTFEAESAQDLAKRLFGSLKQLAKAHQ